MAVWPRADSEKPDKYSLDATLNAPVELRSKDKTMKDFSIICWSAYDSRLLCPLIPLLGLADVPVVQAVHPMG